MKVLLTVSALAIALAVAPVAATPAVRIVRGPSVFHPPWPGGERHVFWRDQDGDHEFWRHRRANSSARPARSSASRPKPEPRFAVAVRRRRAGFIDVTLTPAAGPPPEWTAGPKMIEIGHAEPPRGRMPLIIYGD